MGLDIGTDLLSSRSSLSLSLPFSFSLVLAGRPGAKSRNHSLILLGQENIVFRVSTPDRRNLISLCQLKISGVTRSP